jgi:hypothetical protein
MYNIISIINSYICAHIQQTFSHIYSKFMYIYIYNIIQHFETSFYLSKLISIMLKNETYKQHSAILTQNSSSPANTFNNRSAILNISLIIVRLEIDDSSQTSSIANILNFFEYNCKFQSFFLSLRKLNFNCN